MFGGGGAGRRSWSGEGEQRERRRQRQEAERGRAESAKSGELAHEFGKSADERQQFLSADYRGLQQQGRVKLAKQETIELEERRGCVACKMAANFIRRKWALTLAAVVVSCIAAIYCIPFIEIEPQIPRQLPHIPFNFETGPLAPSSMSSFKIERLFEGQIYGAESVALDSAGNMYLAIEGGFVLYAHLNRSSQPRRPPQWESGETSPVGEPVRLAKIAELNGVRPVPYESRRRARGDGADTSRRRECQLDEQVYGPSLHSGGSLASAKFAPATEAPASGNQEQQEERGEFVSHVHYSRCSKPLGMRLSPDESLLYIIDTYSGLYRVNLRLSERHEPSQRLVSKLIDFRTNKRRALPVAKLGSAGDDLAPLAGAGQLEVARPQELNVTLMAVDDLAVDYGAGTRGGDIIYLTDASQRWLAPSYVFHMLEGRPGGLVLRFDTGSGQLSVLDPNRLAHVRTSGLDPPSLTNLSSPLAPVNLSADQLYMGIGAPRLDENDVFDDRPLNFPNGLELTDDRQAILIADTTNKRIIKHYIRGKRAGTSDLWAWTPHFPDNIRRGHDPRRETYWVAGCGQDTRGKFDLLGWLDSWPRLRKFLAKNFHLLGLLIESLGAHLLRSTSVRDLGFSIKNGQLLIEQMCPGMMILQYNNYGDLIRSIHGKQFPHDLGLQSQVNELIDAKRQEHLLYLSSPSYKFVTKITLPTESFDFPSNELS